MNIQDTIDKVRQWGESRGITGRNGKGTLLGQLSKTQEELTETRDAAVALNTLSPFDDDDSLGRDAAKLNLIDGLGDTMVTLILAAEMAGLRIEDCLQAAYQEIANRKGKMINGVFVKGVSHE